MNLEEERERQCTVRSAAITGREEAYVNGLQVV
jgi:hypothetical protein